MKRDMQPRPTAGRIRVLCLRTPATDEIQPLLARLPPGGPAVTTASRPQALQLLGGDAAGGSAPDLLLLDASAESLEFLAEVREKLILDLPIVLLMPPGVEPPARPPLPSEVTPFIAGGPGYPDLLPLVLENAVLRHQLARERAALDLREAILQSVVQGIVVTDCRYRVEQVNAAFEAITGWSEAELKGRSCSLLQGTGTDPATTAEIRMVLKSGGTFRGQILNYRKDGSPYWAELSIRPYAATANGPVKFVGLIQDITARRTREEQNRLLEAAITSAQDAIIITEAVPLDAPGPFIVFANDAACRLTGYPRAELIGKSPRMFQGPESDRTTKAKIGRALRAGQPVGAEVLNYRKDGSTYWVELGIVPLRDQANRITHYVSVERDLTERRRHEAEREALKGKLVQSQKLEALGTLAGGVAHDFNNLLTGILGSLEVAELDISPEHPAREWIGNSVASALRARELVQQILVFSRKTGSLQSPVALSEIVIEALRLIRASLPAMVRLEQAIAPNCPPVLADSSQIHQVIMNLCTNAWQAVTGNSGVIRVELAAVSVTAADAAANPECPVGPAVRLTVSDNGSGIDESVLPRIFEPFFTTKEVGRGTGLGLAVVHGIVRAHHGTISVRSRPGEGAAFEIIFPALPAGDARTAGGAGKADPDPTARAASGERILLVDDERFVGESIVWFLRRKGYAVTHCITPGAALEHCRSDPASFDLVLTDQSMPTMTGLELAAAIRALAPRLPILLHSGHVSAELAEQAAKAGIARVLQKPAPMDELCAAIASCLAPSRPGGLRDAAT